MSWMCRTTRPGVCCSLAAPAGEPVIKPLPRKGSDPDKSSARDLPTGRFAFKRFLDDAQTQGAVFTINTDGSGEKQITQSADRELRRPARLVTGRHAARVRSL
jgi:hypothetical protein